MDVNNFEGEPRIRELRLGLIEELSIFPSDVPYDLSTRIDKKGWNRCRDEDIYIPSIFRKWVDTAVNTQRGMLSNVASIVKIDIKGDNKSEEDIHKRSRLLDNLEAIVGKGEGEKYIILDPYSRFTILLGHLKANNVYPRYKENRSSVYRTITYDGNLDSGRKSIVRAHHQVANQIVKHAESCVDIGKLEESELITFWGNIRANIETCYDSIQRNKMTENIVLKRLSAMKQDSTFKKLMSPDTDISLSETVDINDILDMRGSLKD